jgi:hypothetical protein
VVLAEGVEVGLVEIVSGVVGVGEGEGDELQPLRTRLTAITETANAPVLFSHFIYPIYLVNLRVENVESHSCSISQESAFW